MRKKAYLFIILTAFYTAVMINYPSPLIKSLGYQQGLNLYAHMVSTRSRYDFISSPGLRKLDNLEGTVRAVTPEQGRNFASILDKHLAQGSSCIIECSELDTWHSSPAGLQYLRKMRPRTYRVVIFDGGHHLPSLGLSPDIIIIPRLAGYAVHSYTLDGVKIATIEKMARECGIPSVIVTVPRMALVKNETAMENITVRILDSCPRQEVAADFNPVANSRMSKYNGFIFAYIDRNYAKNPALFNKRVGELGTKGVKKIYLAFDFKYSSKQQASNYCQQLEGNWELPVECVNQPVKVMNVFWGGR
ncbi:MAG: hypothetical protein WC109_08505 [Syntrophomonadaceae bacterium]|nr:hypothetical protein [Syntrophomonadaceae bacterium]MDD3270682.1 hypothetical protein [Syntrophomonadaceae bacterium]MDD4562171.1 hypothetical protein [Syntrophomonadaceae bacterium]